LAEKKEGNLQPRIVINYGNDDRFSASGSDAIRRVQITLQNTGHFRIEFEEESTKGSQHGILNENASAVDYAHH
jgi:hypothetical protein